MTGTAPAPAGTEGSRAPRRREHRPETLVGLVALTVYLAAAFWLSAHDLVFPDSMSRVANAYYVLFSRDPHLAAIGFVWNPLPSFAAIPLLLASPLWPALAADALAGCLVSAFCGAASVALLYRLLGRLGAGRAARPVLTALFGVHPLVLLAASTGASEAMLLAVCLYVVVHLVDWLAEGDPWRLVHVGVGAGVAYLVRYEALAAGAAVGVLVLVVSWYRSRARGRREALGMALVDVVLAVGPIVAAFCLWALASRVIVGSWLETFTSQYGNSAQVGTFQTSVDGIIGSGAHAHLGYVADQLVHTAPLAVPLALLALAVALGRRQVIFLPPLLVLGSVLAFQNLTFLRNMSFGWLRFQITAVPLGILAAGYLAGAVHRAAPVLRRAGPAVLALAVALPLPVAWRAESDPRLAREETLAVKVAAAGQYEMEQRVADDIAGMGLEEGAVITDVAYSFPIVLSAENPRVYVITTDEDFKDLLARPRENGVDYALLTSADAAPADALEEQYPGMWEDGAGVATMVRQWSDARDLTWRLYRFG